VTDEPNVTRPADEPDADRDAGGEGDPPGVVAPGGTGSSGLQEKDFERQQPEGA
jgi:hypothetical protein